MTDLISGNVVHKFGDVSIVEIEGDALCSHALTVRNSDSETFHTPINRDEPAELRAAKVDALKFSTYGRHHVLIDYASGVFG